MRIVIVGDSHTDAGGFGSTLEKNLEKAGHDVTVLAIGGTAAASWLGKKQPLCRTYGKDKKCASLSDVAGQKFDLAVIALGTNDAGNAYRASVEGKASQKKLLEKVVADVETIGSRLAPRMLWVGPPPMGEPSKHKWYPNKAMDALYDVGLPHFGERAIDSRQILPGPTKIGGDGVHPSQSSYRQWADGVTKVILGQRIDQIPATTSVTETTSTSTPVSSEGGFSITPYLPVMGIFLGTAVALYFVTRRPRAAFAGLGGQRITYRQAKNIRHQLPKSLMDCDYTSDLLQEGMMVELEHRSVTHGDLRKTAMIAAAHLCERPDYYKRLKKYVER